MGKKRRQHHNVTVHCIVMGFVLNLIIFYAPSYFYYIVSFSNISFVKSQE